jgi:AGCS family alanine or glycine:cation symporter
MIVVAAKGSFMQTIDNLNAIIWGPVSVAILIAIHLFITIRTKFIQRKLLNGVKLSVAREKGSKGDISPFKALATSLSATLGVGNIVGVATAVLAGGPGAIFWMWIIGIFGMATSYAETFVAFKYRVRDKSGRIIGGAMYAWRRHFTKKNGAIPWWALLGAGLFAIFAVVKTLFAVSTVQANSVSGIITTNFDFIPNWLVGLGMALAVGLVIIGGLRKIAKVCEFFVPIMVVFYVLACLYILFDHSELVISSIQLIVTDAFSPQAALGGAVGGGIIMALRFGAARGLFTSESGLGSTPIALSAARSRNPARTSLVAMTGVFWDTIIMSAVTGVVIMVTILANQDLQATFLSGGVADGTTLISAVFDSIPLVGNWLLIISITMFAFLTIIGWSYYGNRCAHYLFGHSATRPFNFIYLCAIFVGAISASNLVWHMSDLLNVFMMVPNLIVVLLLSGLVAKETKKYVYDGKINQYDKSKIPTTDR